MVGRGHKGILIIEYQGKIVKWDFMVNKYSFIFNLKAKKKKKKRRGTRWQRSSWTWNTSLSRDTSGIPLQTQNCMQNIKYLTSRKEHIDPCKTEDQALSLWSGSTDSKTLDLKHNKLKIIITIMNNINNE